MTNKM